MVCQSPNGADRRMQSRKSAWSHHQDVNDCAEVSSAQQQERKLEAQSNKDRTGILVRLLTLALAELATLLQCVISFESWHACQELQRDLEMERTTLESIVKLQGELLQQVTADEKALQAEKWALINSSTDSCMPHVYVHLHTCAWGADQCLAALRRAKFDAHITEQEQFYQLVKGFYVQTSAAAQG